MSPASVFSNGHYCSRGVKWNKFWPWPIKNLSLPYNQYAILTTTYRAKTWPTYKQLEQKFIIMAQRKMKYMEWRMLNILLRDSWEIQKSGYWKIPWSMKTILMEMSRASKRADMWQQMDNNLFGNRMQSRKGKTIEEDRSVGRK